MMASLWKCYKLAIQLARMRYSWLRQPNCFIRYCQRIRSFSACKPCPRLHQACLWTVKSFMSCSDLRSNALIKLK